ncbi:hypothetical protein Bbelb_278070 [Branchiostoma belcheri]|nr:hypothetical protein Bbelb_278070 [Branchiostoma belcheri]
MGLPGPGFVGHPRSKSPPPAGSIGPPSLPRSAVHSAGKAETLQEGTVNAARCNKGFTYFEGIGYKIFGMKKSFRIAVTTCRILGATLAMPRDARAKNFLAGMIQAPRTYWIGLSDRDKEGKFKWLDGTTLGKYKQWAPGRPVGNKIGSDKDCVVTRRNSKTSGKWEDRPCSDRYSFICQSVAGCG